MAISSETIRVYDEAVRSWVQTLHVDYGSNFFGKNLSDHPIFFVISAPERAFAEMRNQLIKSGMINPDSVWSSVPDDNNYKQTPMPMVRMQMTDISADPTRHNTPGILRTIAAQGLNWKRYAYPTPYNLSYTIEFVAKTFYAMNYLSEWVLDQFTPVGAGDGSRFITANHPAPYGSTLTEVVFESFSDNSELEAEDGKDRILRKTLTVTLKGWNFDLVGVTVPAVTEISTEVRTPGKFDDLGVFTGELLSNKRANPLVVYSKSPVPPPHTAPFTTATRLMSCGVASGPMDLMQTSQIIETSSIPFRTDHLIQGRLLLRWADLVDASLSSNPLVVEVVWRDAANNYAAQVVQSYTIQPETYQETYGEFLYVSAPQDLNKEIAIRIRLQSGETRTYRVSLDRHLVVKSTIDNLVPEFQRTIGPDIGSTTTGVVVSGATPGLLYAVCGFVDYGSRPVTIQIYDDIASTNLKYQKVFSVAGEFSVLLPASASGDFSIKISTPAPDAALVIRGLVVSKAVPVPFDRV